MFAVKIALPMNVINDLSNDLAQAFLREGWVRRKLNVKDAKSLMEGVAAESIKITTATPAAKDLSDQSDSHFYVSH